MPEGIWWISPNHHQTDHKIWIPTCILHNCCCHKLGPRPPAPCHNHSNLKTSHKKRTSSPSRWFGFPRKTTNQPLWASSPKKLARRGNTLPGLQCLQQTREGIAENHLKTDANTESITKPSKRLPSINPKLLKDIHNPTDEPTKPDGKQTSKRNRPKNLSAWKTSAQWPRSLCAAEAGKVLLGRSEYCGAKLWIEPWADSHRSHSQFSGGGGSAVWFRFVLFWLVRKIITAFMGSFFSTKNLQYSLSLA